MDLENNNKIHGLSTAEALSRLRDEIANILLVYQRRFDTERWTEKLRATFSAGPLHSFAIFTSFLAIVLLLISQNFLAAIIVLALLILNIWLVIRENNLKRSEIHRKIEDVLDVIRLAISGCHKWTASNYPHLCSPLSPCVTLQCTVRDRKIINLPWALLVRGDHIVIRPGQVAPGNCREVNGERCFATGETYTQTEGADPPVVPTQRSPLPDLTCILEGTPFLDNLKTTLEKFLNRPETIFNQQRHLLVTVFIQLWGFLGVILITWIFAVLNYNGHLFADSELTWIDAFMENAVCAVIPTLPLIFPAMWLLLNLWGVAKLETLLSIPRPFQEKSSPSEFHADLDNSPVVDWSNLVLPWRIKVGNWINLIQGDASVLGRSSNVVQILGTMTALCCVDKKGILSWPNPTAEKVFFLRDPRDKTSAHSSSTSFESQQNGQRPQKDKSVAEVLDLTHDQHSPFKLEFDSQNWKNHLDSLKPLGLAILVNTCCPLTQAYYAQFCGHVTAVALFDKDLVPVTNRRCLCGLATKIGFKKRARDVFTMEGKIASYRHLEPDVVRRDTRFTRSMELASKVKVPFPHSLSVVMRQHRDQSLQLLTQGTADIILDCCDDYWDGKDLRPLGEQERKRAQDFYQRNALTAYCTAFSYRPLRRGIKGPLAGTSTDVAYMELPPESIYKMSHIDPSKCEHIDTAEERQKKGAVNVDSVNYTDTKAEKVNDVEGCFEMECHQIFIGMVTMQYQAQMDIVHLIERLDRACIRFVHFSKENELRSRVFSEKMGLESGWNCHISLLSGVQSEEQQHDEVPPAMPDEDAENEESQLLPENRRDLTSSASGSMSNVDSLEGACGVDRAALDDSIKLDVVDETDRHPSNDSTLACDNPGTSGTSGNAGNAPTKSLSCLTDSTEHSDPVLWNANKAKLPRGIENIRPHLEKVDNVPLLVSLFTDCSADATREMLGIMQSYGEIVVCLGSSANATNCEIFLQADCSIGVEPFYPQVCQDIPAYIESNLTSQSTGSYRSRLAKWLPPRQYNKNAVISPVYLSRLLNSLSCSIAISRDDPLSIVALIELSRRVTTGVWNCLQFLMCCLCSLAVVNTLSAFVGLHPIFPPLTLIYLMVVVIPLISLTLTRVPNDQDTMQRATWRKSKMDKNLCLFVFWCYCCKFIPSIVVTFAFTCVFLGHPVALLAHHGDSSNDDLKLVRYFTLYGIIIHFVVISSSFVHRSHLLWQRNPFSNSMWVICTTMMLTFHTILLLVQVLLDDDFGTILAVKWPGVVFLLLSSFVVLSIVELIKREEIKANNRYQRRARLDFGTKLGMNSPF
ncbi:transmembrane protein 94 isoform X2 [Lutzomyia longipalpis]|uniref:transmembrane protein 94 isoform X2 n=1 Tax=Lutzomyia longipalpis TaxID=7200 RepID=UPI00248346BA|nr:transmembrane protein 94 isoform X2 [Lutzomyia longipalpis]